jgi:hypothetical protein
MGRSALHVCHVPPWPNGQGVGLLIRRLRVRVPQEVTWCPSERMRFGGLAHHFMFACYLLPMARCFSRICNCTMPHEMDTLFVTCATIRVKMQPFSENAIFPMICVSEEHICVNVGIEKT